MKAVARKPRRGRKTAGGVTSVSAVAAPLSLSALHAMSDEDLATLAAGTGAHSERAWAVLYERVWPFALRVAGRVLSRRPDTNWTPNSAEDVAQEGLLRAWEYRGNYSPGLPYRPWLAHIVANRARSDCAKASRRAEASRALGILNAAVQSSSVAERWMADPPLAPDFAASENASRIHMLKNALAALSEKDRRLLELWAEGRQSEYRDPSGEQLSPSTIRLRVHRAKARLRSEMGVTEEVLEAA